MKKKNKCFVLLVEKMEDGFFVLSSGLEDQTCRIQNSNIQQAGRWLGAGHGRRQGRAGPGGAGRGGPGRAGAGRVRLGTERGEAERCAQRTIVHFDILGTENKRLLGLRARVARFYAARPALSGFRNSGRPSASVARSPPIGVTFPGKGGLI